MRDLQFEWDEAKATANARKHGITFEEAQTVFFDDFALLIDDPDHSATESRFVLLGLSASARTRRRPRVPLRPEHDSDHLGSQGHEGGAG